ncbi:YcgN family cysteine cluster protein [Psychrobacter pygoscelis]|uniref:YcgN family cysteine cluster protein n=1 Tax=Psychrobacter pygoscelis TaxID=2488563 RepID=UPI00104072E3|nr:YcgN family cysteine cluster protein [Psychrobacter pygoscelis]
MRPIATTPELRAQFWQRFALDELTTAEWEALCDGCGACCLIKFLEDDDAQTDVEYTDVACRLLDCESGYCSNYADRQKYVPDCVSLTPDKLVDMMWLPSNCAYKRLYLGQDLPEWHLLITGDAVATQQGMREAGVGVAGRCVSEVGISEEELEERVVTWIEV